MSRSKAADPSGLPFPPGQSPFQVRGLNYTAIREHCLTEVPGGLPAVLSRLPSESLRRFLDQPFFAMSTYDALPIMPITVAIAEQEGRIYEESVSRRVSRVAKRDMNGLYKRLMSFVSPELAMKGLERIWARYFNFGRIEFNALGRRACELAEVGVPQILVPWFSSMSPTYLSVVLDLTGVHGVSVQARGAKPAGTRDGVDLATIRFEATWR